MKQWNQEDIATLRRLYPEGQSSEIALMLGRSERAVRAQAHRLGLEKSREYMNLIKSKERKYTGRRSQCPQDLVRVAVKGWGCR